MLLQVTQNERTVESFFPQSYAGFQQHDLTEISYFLVWGYRKKTILDQRFDICDERTEQSKTIMLFNALFVKEIDIKVEFFHNVDASLKTV